MGCICAVPLDLSSTVIQFSPERIFIPEWWVPKWSPSAVLVGSLLEGKPALQSVLLVVFKWIAHGFRD